MADDEHDLWGDLEPLMTSDNPVRALLEEQARLLEEKTRGLIVSWVESRPAPDGWQIHELRAASKTHPGEVVSLVKAWQSRGMPDELRLLRTTGSHRGNEWGYDDQSSFARALAADLQGEVTRGLLADLLDQARAATEAAARGTSSSEAPSATAPLVVDALVIRSWRSIAALDFEIGLRTVLFGPNGAGKSSILDAFALLGDFTRRGTTAAVSTRGSGWELLHDRAEVASFELGVVTNAARYSVTLAVREGRIDPVPGESLRLTSDGMVGFSREPGERFALGKAQTEHLGRGGRLAFRDRHALVRPEESSLLAFAQLDHAAAPTLLALHAALSGLRVYHGGRFDLDHLRRRGSDAQPTTVLDERGENLWAVLRTLRERDPEGPRALAIEHFMRRAFPEFQSVRTEQIGPEVVVGRIVERHRRRPLSAAAAPDGLLHLLLVLTAMFAPEPGECPLVLLDEPDTSLHPWALVVLAEATQRCAEMGRRVVLATHSPVLLSQFAPSECRVVEQREGATQVTPLEDIEGIADLLDDYAAGALYMAQVIAPQRPMPEGVAHDSAESEDAGET